MEAVTNDFISRELVQDPTPAPPRNATPMLDTDILDSLNLLGLVMYVQEQFGIVVDDVDLLPEHFGSVYAIYAYLRTQAEAIAPRVGGRG